MDNLTLISGSPPTVLASPKQLESMQVAPLIYPYSMQKPARLEALENVFREWLYIEDEFYLENLLATYLTIQYPGDPYWEMAIGPPGIGKTEGMESLTELPNIYTLSKITPYTLISGFAVTDKDGSRLDDSDYDLYPQLVDKLLIVKDWSSIDGQGREARKQIYADFREAFDGKLEKAYGSRKGKKSCRGTFGLLAGTTPEADASMWLLNQALGERFCRFRLRCEDTAKAVRKARECRGREKQMRQALKASVGACLGQIWQDPPPYADVSDEANEQIEALADLTAILRTSVKRDGQGNVVTSPQAEVGTRLVKQFQKLGLRLRTSMVIRNLESENYNILQGWPGIQ
jgi:hypothetical protein